MKRNQKIIHLLIVFFALFMICVAPMISDLYSYNKVHVSVDEENVQYASIKNTTVTQKIYLEGYISNLGVAFYAPSGNLYENAEVVISICQGNKIVTESLKAVQLRTASAYEVDPITNLETNEYEEMLYILRSNLHCFSKGEATISIVGENLPQGTDLFCKVSDTLVSGLPSANAGGNVLGHPLVVEYDVFKIDNHFFYETILLALLITAIFITSWLVTDRKGGIIERGGLFWCASAIIFLTVSIRNPYASFWGEPRSEAAYEFWYKAEHMGFWGSLMSLMSGEALAWWERILMWISTEISPVRYVFKTAQLLELLWISFVTALPCGKKFRMYFGADIRLIFSVFIGTSLVFDSMYYFWSCSYWALIFFVLFSLLPLEELKKPVYYVGLVLTIVLCVSRIYYIILIPLAVILLFVLGNRHGKRFRIFCTLLIISCCFEGVYSLMSGENLASGSSLIQGILDIGIGRMIVNTVYYQIQVLNSFFFGNIHWSGSGTNILFLLIIIGVILLFISMIYKKKIEEACFIGSMGYISLSTIAINIYVSGSHPEVSFPYNYSTAVNWADNYYQQADLHFSFAYICVAFLLMALLYVCKNYFKEIFSKSDIVLFKNGNMFFEKCVLLVAFSTMFAFFASVSVKPRMTYGDKGIVVEWDALYKITEQEKYFAAINMFYRAAPISLEQGTDELIFGIDETGKLYQWKYGTERYEMEKPYNIAEIGAVSDVESKDILSITARVAITNFDVNYVAVFYDREGNEIARVLQAEKENRLWRNFILPDALKGVYKVSFELEDGSIAYIDNAIQVGYIIEE